MLGFMPSEIARLVLGYLDELECEQTKGKFLIENVHIQEYARCLDAGLKYPTTIEGKNLQEILQSYYLLTHQVPRCSTDQQDPTPSHKNPISNVDVSNGKEPLRTDENGHKEERLRKVLGKSRPDFKSKKNTPVTHLKSKQNLQSSLKVKPKQQEISSRFQETGSEAYSSESETDCNDCPSVTAEIKQSKKCRIGFNRTHSARTALPICRSPSESSDTSEQQIEIDRASLLLSSIDRCTSPLSPFVIERPGGSTPKPDDVQTDKYSQASIQTSPRNESNTNCQNSTQCRKGASTVVSECSVPYLCSVSDVYTRSKPIRGYTAPGSYTPPLNLSDRPVVGSQCNSPLNLAFEKSSCSPRSKNFLKNIKTELDDNIPVIELSSPEHTRENIFLEVSSLGAQASVCPENIINVDKTEIQAPVAGSQLQTEADTQNLAMPAQSLEVEAACRIFSIENKRLDSSDRQHLPLPNNSKTAQPKESGNFKKPTSISSVASPVCHSLYDVSSASNSPSVNLLSPSLTTPVNSVEPDLPARYPEVTSPRYILSEQRAKAPSLATPVKEYHQAVVNQQAFFSPKRKSQIPRRRLISSPSVHSRLQSEQAVNKEGDARESSTSDEVMDWTFLLELASSTEFHSILTENINKHEIRFEMSPGENVSREQSLCSSQSSQVPTVHIPDDVVRDIISQAESNPECRGILNRHCENLEFSRHKVTTSSSADSWTPNLDETLLMEDNDSTRRVEGQNSAFTESVITTPVISATAIPMVLGNPTIVTIPSSTSVCNNFVSTTSNTFQNPHAIQLPVLSGATMIGVPALGKVQNTILNSATISTPNKNSCTITSLRPIRPSPKKDILQETLDFLDIRESPAKSIELIATTTTATQQSSNSDYGTCIQIFSQPIMSSKPSSTFIVNGTALTPVKVNIPGINVLSFSQGQMYSSYLNGIIQPNQDQNQETSSHTNLPIFVTAAPKAVPAHPKRLSQGLARRKNMKEKLYQQTAKTAPVKDTCKEKGRVAQFHVRSLDFGREPVGKKAKSPSEVQENSRKENTETPVPVQINVPITRAMENARKGKTLAIVADTTEVNNKKVAAKPIIVAKTRSVAKSRTKANTNKVGYVSSSGEQQHVSTIDMSHLDLIRDSTSASSSHSVSSTTPSSDTEAAAVTLMTLANKTFPYSKVNGRISKSTNKDSARVKDQDSRKSKKRKRSSKDRKGVTEGYEY